MEKTKYEAEIDLLVVSTAALDEEVSEELLIEDPEENEKDEKDE